MENKAQNPRVAVIFMLSATAFIAGTMLMAKLLGTDALGPALHPMQVSFGRFLFALLVISSAIAAMRPKFSRPSWRIHIGRTTFGWVGVTLMFASVAFIPLGDATAISFLNPVFGMIFAIPFLGERVGRWRWLAAAMAFLGALVLLRPGGDGLQFGALLALAAAIFLGMELIFIKKLANREKPIQILFINNAMGATIATIAVSFVWQNPTMAQWICMGVLGLLMASAQACFVNAMARADASFVTPFSYLTLVFAVLYDLVFFSILPDWVSWLGAAIIIAGAVLLAWREALQRK